MQYQNFSTQNVEDLLNTVLEGYPEEVKTEVTSHDILNIIYAGFLESTLQVTLDQFVQAAEVFLRLSKLDASIWNRFLLTVIDQHISDNKSLSPSSFSGYVEQQARILANELRSRLPVEPKVEPEVKPRLEVSFCTSRDNLTFIQDTLKLRCPMPDSPVGYPLFSWELSSAHLEDVTFNLQIINAEGGPVAMVSALRIDGRVVAVKTSYNLDDLVFHLDMYEVKVTLDVVE